MNMILPTSIKDDLQQHGFAHIADVSDINRIKQSADYTRFVQSWNDLQVDTHLNDHGKYRYRRYSVFTVHKGNLTQLPPEPHYQARKYNKLHGGTYRDYDSFLPETANSQVLHQLITTNMAFISPNKRSEEHISWRIQAHQFRICATDKEAGKPSPEGIHQDGADYVFIMLVNRQNIVGASNTVHNKAGDVLYGTTMTKSGEAIIIDDKRLWHGVSKVYPDDKRSVAYRDVLVLTFHKNNTHKE